MATVLARRTQLLFQEQHTGGLGRVRLKATLQPFTVGIVDPLAQAQPALQGSAGGLIAHTIGQLLIQQRRHQSPGLGGSGLFQGPLNEVVPLLQRQVRGQHSSPAPAGRCRHAGLPARQQHLCSLAIGLEAHQVVGQQIKRHPLAGLLARPIGFGHRQEQGFQAAEITIGQLGQGLHSLGVVEAGVGSAPLELQPVLPRFIAGRRVPLQQGQGLLGCTAGQQGFHRGQGLGLGLGPVGGGGPRSCLLAQGTAWVNGAIGQDRRCSKQAEPQQRQRRRKPGQRLPQWGGKMGHGAHSCWLGMAPAT